MKSLTLHTHGCLGENLRDCSFVFPKTQHIHYLKVVLQIIDKKRHVTPEPPLGGASICTVHMSPLHLQRPAMLKLQLNASNVQKKPKYSVVPINSIQIHIKSF